MIKVDDRINTYAMMLYKISLFKHRIYQKCMDIK